MSNKNELYEANAKLGIKEDMDNPKNRTLVFVYTYAKTGSTALVSSIRLSCFENITVIHIHNDNMLRHMYNIDNCTLSDIIEFNRSLKKNVYVFDIFRHPVEHKMSLFFDILDTFHFNVNTSDIHTLTVEKIIKRFNNIYPHIIIPDYFESVYNFEDKSLSEEPFDHEKGYLHLVDSNGINYIKLRLMDAETTWSSILSEIFAHPSWIVKDNVTGISKPPMHILYQQFKDTYRLPNNYFEDLENNNMKLNKYLTLVEKESYLNKWKMLTDTDKIVKPFTSEEYKLYIEISKENKHLSQFKENHYIDNGCDCNECKTKRNHTRKQLYDKVVNKVVKQRSFSLMFI